jgi:hypothetical protein
MASVRSPDAVIQLKCIQHYCFVFADRIRLPFSLGPDGHHTGRAIQTKKLTIMLSVNK